MAGMDSSEGSSSKSLLWMMVALFTVIAILLGGGLFLASRVLHAFHLQESGGKATMRTPMGDIHVEKANEVGPSMPVYSGSILVMPHDDDGKAGAPPSAEFAIQTAAYYTPDSGSFVENWYREHLGSEFTWHAANEEPRFELLGKAGVSTGSGAFVAERGEQVRIVAIEEDPSGTHIKLIHIRRRTAH
jgi:hypothetical protein